MIEFLIQLCLFIDSFQNESNPTKWLTNHINENTFDVYAVTWAPIPPNTGIDETKNNTEYVNE